MVDITLAPAGRGPEAGMGPESVSRRKAEHAGLAFDAGSYVEWPSVFVGAVVALSVAFVLLSFGAAVGLTAVSPWTSTRGAIVAVSIGAAFWMILVHVWAFGLGGYLAGRMRHRRSGATPTEVEFRDGTHGVAVWGLSVTTGAVVAALVAASIARGGLELGASAARTSDPTVIATDLLLRTARPTTDARPEDVRGELSRLLLRSAGRAEMAAIDRTYIAELVAARTGLASADAAKRVDEIIVQLKDTTNRARKMGVILGFITAATLLLAAAAAWWGATIGGRHRDENTIWAGFAKHAPGSSLWTKT